MLNSSLCPIVLFIVLLGATAAGADLPHPHLPIRLRTDHFMLETDISKEFLRHMAPFLEAAHREISALPGFQPKSSRHKIEGIWVFFSKNQESFTAYTKSEGSFVIPSRASGRAYIRCVPSSLYETRRRTLHELCHVYLWAAGLSISSGDRPRHALEQRMCDVVSWHHWDGKNLKICHAPNAPGFQIKAVTGIKAEQWESGGLGVLQPFRGAKRSTGDIYAITHFLLTDTIGQEFFRKYAINRRKGGSPQEAATRAAGRNEASVDVACSSHAKQLTVLSRWALENPVPEISYEQYTEDLKLQRERLKTYRSEEHPGHSAEQSAPEDER